MKMFGWYIDFGKLASKQHSIVGFLFWFSQSGHLRPGISIAGTKRWSKLSSLVTAWQVGLVGFLKFRHPSQTEE